MLFGYQAVERRIRRIRRREARRRERLAAQRPRGISFEDVMRRAA